MFMNGIILRTVW